MAAQSDPMADLLKQLKAEARAAKNAEIASKDLAKELGTLKETADEALKSLKAEVAAQKDAEIASKAFAAEMSKWGPLGQKAATGLSITAGAMSTLGSGRVASLGTALGSLVSHFQGFGKLEGTGAKAGSVLNMIGAGKQALGSLAGIVQSVGSVASVASMALGAVGGAVGGLTGVLTAPIDAIQKTVDAISQFVQLASPATFLQFTRAMDDFMATVGQGLAPVMEGLTSYVQSVADATARLMPVLQPLFDTLGETFAQMGVIAAETIAAWAPVIQLLADGLIPVIRGLARGFAMVEGFVIELVRTITGLLGLTSRYDPSRSSRGAAFKGVSVSSVDEFSRAQFAKMVEGAFGGGNGINPQKVQQEIAQSLKEGRQVMVDLRTAVKELLAWLRNPGKETRQAVQDRAGEVARNPLAPAEWLWRAATLE